MLGLTYNYVSGVIVLIVKRKEFFDFLLKLKYKGNIYICT